MPDPVPTPKCLHGNTWNECKECPRKRVTKTGLHLWLDMVAAHVATGKITTDDSNQT